MAKFGSRLARLAGPSTGSVSVGNVDAEIAELARRNPCLPHHRPPEGLSPDEHLRRIDQMLTDHEQNGADHDKEWGKYNLRLIHESQGINDV